MEATNCSNIVVFSFVEQARAMMVEPEYHNLQPVGQSHVQLRNQVCAGANLESHRNVHCVYFNPMSIDFTKSGTARGLNPPAYDSLSSPGNPILISLIWAPLSTLIRGIGHLNRVATGNLQLCDTAHQRAPSVNEIYRFPHLWVRRHHSDTVNPAPFIAQSVRKGLSVMPAMGAAIRRFLS